MNNINVFTGPMKSGKSSTIIKTANELKNKGENVKVFKPTIDDRFGTGFVQDRNGNKIDAININKIEELENYDADSYVIDEFQFLEGNLNIIKNLANRGKKFYIAGLNLTTEKKVFGHMGEIMEASDNVQMFKAHCDFCASANAIYSYCTAPKTGDILVAGDDVYFAVCPECYDRLEFSRK
ncbi:MAG: hypothetical protein J6A36_00020 [Clostridia bacterium]|nr:hypothetical protein [Clostridia bacterium]